MSVKKKTEPQVKLLPRYVLIVYDKQHPMHLHSLAFRTRKAAEEAKVFMEEHSASIQTKMIEEDPNE